MNPLNSSVSLWVVGAREIMRNFPMLQQELQITTAVDSTIISQNGLRRTTKLCEELMKLTSNFLCSFTACLHIVNPEAESMTERYGQLLTWVMSEAHHCQTLGAVTVPCSHLKVTARSMRAQRSQ